MNRTHGPDQRYAPTDYGRAEGDIDDEDDPPVRVIAPECHDARHDVDDAGNEKAYDQEDYESGVAPWRLRSRMHVTPPASRWRR